MANLADDGFKRVPPLRRLPNEIDAFQCSVFEVDRFNFRIIICQIFLTIGPRSGSSTANISGLSGLIRSKRVSWLPSITLSRILILKQVFSVCTHPLFSHQFCFEVYIQASLQIDKSVWSSTAGVIRASAPVSGYRTYQRMNYGQQRTRLTIPRKRGHLLSWARLSELVPISDVRNSNATSPQKTT